MVSAALIAFSLLSQTASSQLVQLRHWTGQSVAPVYEGFNVNPDGSFNMWFGYMNRNYEEQLDIPVGPNNQFEPGGQDRGQPTHFAVRRHKDVFKVVVPKDFGDQKLVWTIIAHGQTQQVAGTLNPVWMIDRLRTTRGGNSESIDSNTPPVVSVEAPSQITLPGSVKLSVSATDDGLPKRAGKTVGMTIVWAKYRGPGAVVFAPAKAAIGVGKADAPATFSEPGEYVLQSVVD